MISREPAAFRPRTNRRGLTIAIVIVVIVLLTLRGLATFWTDFLWFQSIDLSSVWSTLLLSRVVSGRGGFDRCVLASVGEPGFHRPDLASLPVDRSEP